MYKFLPSYVGSKKYWLDFLKKYKNQHFVELFCGSSVISANLAKTAILVDTDPYLCKILGNFDQLIVPPRFTQEDYFKSRPLPDWWKYAYCFQKMSFSGVFRHSKNGYNVPIKKHVLFVELADEYAETLKRWRELSPQVFNTSYDTIDLNLLLGKVVVLDPPYEGSKASYNSKFDYDAYWLFVDKIKPIAKILIIFDRARNLESHGVPILSTRRMVVNGQYGGDDEAVGIFENGGWLNVP